MVVNVGDSPCVVSNTTCSFGMANGACLTVIGVLGCLMSGFTLYCLIFHVKLQGKNMFIINVSVSDIMMAVLGTIRGLGILSPYYIGVQHDPANHDGDVANWWCKMYTIIGNSLWYTAIPMLVPLTLDRFLAVVFARKYKTHMTPLVSKMMIFAMWIPIVVVFIYDCITYYAMDGFQIVYQKSFHRCVYEKSTALRTSALTIFPFIMIVVMYISMLFFVNKMNIDTKRLLIMATAIIITGLVAYTPDIFLSAFEVRMSYEVGQITTVTFYYMNSIWNPIIYFCTNPYAKRDLAATTVGRRISQATFNGKVMESRESLRESLRESSRAKGALLPIISSPIS